jgi:hypothetical protein
MALSQPILTYKNCDQSIYIMYNRNNRYQTVWRNKGKCAFWSINVWHSLRFLFDTFRISFRRHTSICFTTLHFNIFINNLSNVVLSFCCMLVCWHSLCQNFRLTITFCCKLILKVNRFGDLLTSRKHTVAKQWLLLLLGKQISSIVPTYWLFYNLFGHHKRHWAKTPFKTAFPRTCRLYFLSIRKVARLNTHY